MATPWGRIKARFLKGDITYAELAEKYHLSEKTIRNRAYKEGWRKAKDEVRAKTGQKLVERASDERARELESIISATDRMGTLLDKLMQEFENKPIEVLMADPKGTESYARAIETIARAKRDLYMLPTWDQMHRKEMDRERLKLEKAKLAEEKKRTAALQQKTGGGRAMNWEIKADGEEDAVSG